MLSCLFVGGVRSGKSGLAQKWAERIATHRLYVATCQPVDAEMEARVEKHKATRGSGWDCIEAPLEPLAAIGRHPALKTFGAIVLDCLSMWLANMFAKHLEPEHMAAQAGELFRGLADLPCPCAIVSAECGLGFVPDNALARAYGDMLGQINQQTATLADNVIFASCGLPLILKGQSPTLL